MSERERLDGQCVSDLPECVVCGPSEGEPLRLVSDSDPWAGDRTPRTNAKAEYIRADIAEQQKAELAALLSEAIKALPVNHEVHIRARALLAKHEAGSG